MHIIKHIITIPIALIILVSCQREENPLGAVDEHIPTEKLIPFEETTWIVVDSIKPPVSNPKLEAIISPENIYFTDRYSYEDKILWHYNGNSFEEIDFIQNLPAGINPYEVFSYKVNSDNEIWAEILTADNNNECNGFILGLFDGSGFSYIEPPSSEFNNLNYLSKNYILLSTLNDSLNAHYTDGEWRLERIPFPKDNLIYYHTSRTIMYDGNLVSEIYNKINANTPNIVVLAKYNGNEWEYITEDYWATFTESEKWGQHGFVITPDNKLVSYGYGMYQWNGNGFDRFYSLEGSRIEETAMVSVDEFYTIENMIENIIHYNNGKVTQIKHSGSHIKISAHNGELYQLTNENGIYYLRKAIPKQ